MKLAAALLACLVVSFAHASAPGNAATSGAVQELRLAAGHWNVTTTRYRDNGSVAGVATGTWQFEWVVPDRVLAGRYKIPDWKESAAVLLYVDASREALEMAAVGADGELVVMSSPASLGTHARRQAKAPEPRALTRFTRFSIAEDRFEAKVERSLDGGRTWRPSEHHLFVRAPARQEPATRMQHRTRPQPYIPLT